MLLGPVVRWEDWNQWEFYQGIKQAHRYGAGPKGNRIPPTFEEAELQGRISSMVIRAGPYLLHIHVLPAAKDMICSWL